MTLQIIYTPDASDFMLDHSRIGHLMPTCDEAVQRLRQNYPQLKEQVGDLPAKVGIVTYFDRVKHHLRDFFQDTESLDSGDGRNYFLVLNVLRRGAETADWDLNDPIKNEFAYRVLSRMLMHHTISNDSDLRSRKEIFLASTLPINRSTLTDLRKIPISDDIGAGYEKLTESIRKLLQILPSYEDFLGTYQEMQALFEAHKVSPDFPLYYTPPETAPVLFYSVSLDDSIEVPNFMPGLMEILELGAKASGMAEIPANVLQDVKMLEKDKFGETKILPNLDALLFTLPEPKTIITDLYVLSQCPSLREADFETVEFRL